MTYAQFQEHFEQTAALERATFEAMPFAEFMQNLRSGKFGECYQIWHVLAERATPSTANNFLLSFLSSSAPYLHRYHAAAALISLNDLHSLGWEAYHLSASAKYPVAKNLAKVREELEQA